MHLAVLVGTAVVLDEAKLSELIHKKVDARARSADHRRQGRNDQNGDMQINASLLAKALRK